MNRAASLFSPDSLLYLASSLTAGLSGFIWAKNLGEFFFQGTVFFLGYGAAYESEIFLRAALPYSFLLSFIFAANFCLAEFFLSRKRADANDLRIVLFSPFFMTPVYLVLSPATRYSYLFFALPLIISHFAATLVAERD